MISNCFLKVYMYLNNRRRNYNRLEDNMKVDDKSRMPNNSCASLPLIRSRTEVIGSVAATQLSNVQGRGHASTGTVSSAFPEITRRSSQHRRQIGLGSVQIGPHTNGVLSYQDLQVTRTPIRSTNTVGRRLSARLSHNPIMNSISPHDAASAEVTCNAIPESSHQYPLVGNTNDEINFVKSSSPYDNYIERRSNEINNIRAMLIYKHYGPPNQLMGSIAHYCEENIGNGTEDDSFVASYQRDKWIFIESRRGAHELYNMSDVVAEQYGIVSRRDDFFGLLPSVIRRHNICNEHTLKILKDSRHLPESERLKRFMKETVNGKSTQRIADVFGMEPYGLQEKLEDGIPGVNIIMRVKT